MWSHLTEISLLPEEIEPADEERVVNDLCADGTGHFARQ
jgi:hypothetical protein